MGDQYFYNLGAVVKSVTTGTTQIDVFFANTGGTVQAQSGTIQFGDGSDMGGGFQAATNAAIYFAGGVDNFSGVANFQGPGQIGVNGTPELNGTLSGVLNIYGGGIAPGSALTVATNGILNIEGSIEVYGVLTNQGAVNWLAGNITVENDTACSGCYGGPYTGVIWNEPGALWSIECDQNMTGDWLNLGDQYFYNLGAVVKSVTTGSTEINVFFANTGGTVQAQSGTIQFADGSDIGGEFQAATNAAIYFAGGDFPLTGVQNLQGPGQVGINGTPELNGTLSTALNIYGGGIATGSALTVATDGILNIEGSIVIFGILTNQGTVNWLAGNITVENDTACSGCYGGPYTGVIWNEPGAIWNIQCDQGMTGDWLNLGDQDFYNLGAVVKSVTTGTTQINVFFANAGGTVEAQSGTIQFTDGSDMGGGFQAATNAAIYFAGGDFPLTGVQNLQGPGQVGINGTPALNGTLSGALNIYGGGIWPGSALTIATNGILNIEGSIQVYGILTNQGTVNWLAGSIQLLYNGGSYLGEIWNQPGAVWNMQCDQAMNWWSGEEQFNNGGVLRKTNSFGASAIYPYVDNSGTIDAQSGSINFSGATPTLEPAGALNFGINGLLDFGKISISSATALNGVVGANFNDGYVPYVGDSFSPLSYASATGAFTGLSLPSDMSWQTNYSSVVFTLTVSQGLEMTPIPTQFINGAVPFTIPVAVADSEVPPDSLAYSLVNPPAELPLIPALEPSVGLPPTSPPRTRSWSTSPTTGRRRCRLRPASWSLWCPRMETSPRSSRDPHHQHP